VQPPVNSFRAILHAVQQSYEISRARARERERRCCPLTKVVESCCVAQHGSQALVSTTVSLHNSRPSAASTSRCCGMALCHVATRVAPTRARVHTRARNIASEIAEHVGSLVCYTCATPTTWVTLLSGCVEDVRYVGDEERVAPFSHLARLYRLI
jgi:hypothetical protein